MNSQQHLDENNLDTAVQGNVLNITPLDITNQATMINALRIIEDPEQIMAICNGPAFPKTQVNEYTPLVNIHSNRDISETIFNGLLSTFGDNLINSGFSNRVSPSSGSAITVSLDTAVKDIKVARTGNLAIFQEYNTEVRENAIPRGQNISNNAGPNTIGKYNYFLNSYTFDTATTSLNVEILHNFLSIYCPPLVLGAGEDGIQIVKLSTFESNLRNNTPFPGYPYPSAFPGKDEFVCLDLSSLRNVSISHAIIRNLNAITPTKTFSTGNKHIKLYVDISNTIEGYFSSVSTSTTVFPEVGYTSPTAPIIARILDDTLTRQDIRFGLFLSVRPFARYLQSSDINKSRTTSINELNLGVYLPKADPREVYMNWLAKNTGANNEFTLSNMVASHSFFNRLIRDVRICKTFLIQVAAYMCKVEYIPDSNALMTPSRITQLIGFNLTNLGDIYQYTLNESDKYAHWLSWIPYELAKSTNNSVKFDEPRWRVSTDGRKVADKVKRSRSIIVPTGTTTSNTAYNLISETLSLSTNISNSKQLTIAAQPVSIYYNNVVSSIFTQDFSEGVLIEDNYLEDYNFFPDFNFEESWN